MTAGRSITLVPSATPRVLLDLTPTRRAGIDIAVVLGGVVLTSLLAQISLPIPPSPVPVTGQTLAVGLVGASLGARRGMASLAAYVALGLVAPVYAGGARGLGVVTGPSGGYLVGFVFAAWVMGRLAEHGADRRALTAFAGFIASQVIIFSFGLAGLELALARPSGWTVHNGLTIFIEGGVIKALVGAALLPSAWRIASLLKPHG